ncbi:LuxR C-terminal-related transcriptional regulator [Owenweeksia hongkongensis]|uniref:LuxR C-terminal-related transcriptional regulator n=1 Tax=Owenweeksia hongkongensis TaxID=253245 RepID=UPI003A8D9685
MYALYSYILQGNMDSDLLDFYNEIFETNYNLDREEVIMHIKKLKELDKFLPPSSSFFILSDTPNNNFPYVSKNFVTNLGLDPELMNSVGVPYWLGHHHPDDLPVWMQILQDLMAYTLTEVEPEDRKKLSYTWTFRVRTAAGNFVNLFEHMVPMELDAEGKPVIGLAHITVVGDGEALPLKCSVKKLNDNNEYETLLTKNYSQILLSDGVTNRERDIIRLLALGNNSKQISQKLFISPHTVDTHRRNILKKLKVSSTGELVAYFTQQQLF